MNEALLALTQEAPPGFERRGELAPRDVRRGAFALFAASLAAAETALAPYRDSIVGLVVTFEESWNWQDRGRGLYHLAVPPALRGALPGLLRPYLDLLNAQLRSLDAQSQMQLDLDRAADDRARLVREFADLRASLLTEITERRNTERALQAAHDELELRVQQRTAELATTNAALETEVAERRRADLALAEQRHRFDTLMESVPDSIYFKDEQSRFVQINHALARLFGLASPEEAVGRTDFEFFAREHAQPAFEDEQTVMRTGQPITGKIERETLPGGKDRWGLTTKMPLRDSTGRIIGTFGLTRDITDIKHAQDELSAANERLQEVLADLTRSHEELKRAQLQLIQAVGSSRVDLQACKLEYSIVSPK